MIIKILISNDPIVVYSLLFVIGLIGGIVITTLMLNITNKDKVK